MSAGAPGADSTSTGPTLEDFAGMVLGDYGESSDEGAESPAPAAGDPPAPAPDPAAVPAARTEGAATAEHAGDPPAVAASATPDPAAPVPPLDDPLATATPLTYTVDGQQRTFEGIRLLGEHGAIVPAEHLAKLQQRLSERDHLFETAQRRQQQFTDLEKLTTWQIKDAQGNPQTLVGREAAETHRVLTARSIATLNTLVSVFTDPQKFADLVAVADDGQGNPVIVINEAVRNHLFTQAELAATRAETGARAYFATLAAPASAAAAPEVSIQELAAPTVDANLRALGITTMAPESKTFLVQQLPRYVRATTAEERRADPSLGTRIVDASFVDLVKREASRAVEASQIASAATSAARGNSAVLAAAALGGKRPAAAAPAARPAARAPSPATTRETDADAAWDLRERAAAAGI